MNTFRKLQIDDLLVSKVTREIYFPVVSVLNPSQYLRLVLFMINPQEF